jgi:integrase
MLVKCKVNFYLEKRKAKGGRLIETNVPINMFFSFAGKRLVYFSGYRTDINKWDVETQRVRPGCLNQDGITATTINNHLDDLQVKVKEIYAAQRALKRKPSIEFIRAELRRCMADDTRGPAFFDVWSLFVETERQAKGWTAGTLQKIDINLDHLKNFQSTKRYRLDFDNINEAFFTKYIAYLRDDRGQRNATISKNINVLKWFLNWATERGYNDNLDYKKHGLKLKGATMPAKIIFLTWPELMHLYSLEISKAYLAQVRDVFCFTCFTGLRYSDVKNLKRSDIKAEVIEITTIKTSDSLTIDLNQYSRAILDKYKDMPLEDNRALPVISNQKYNKYLKELGQLAELNSLETLIYYKGAERKEETYKKSELLTSHAGRKTFVSNALFFNIPAEVVMSWTGHKDHKVMESYYKIIGTQKRREMSKFNGNGTTK